MSKYTVTAPKTPGALATSQSANTLAQARAIAKELAGARYLTHQDVRIDRADGHLVEYAGPCR